MNDDKLISAGIEDFYARASEENRLKEGLGPLEFERNKDLIGRFLPPGQGVVLDVGGGPGIYAEWLAGMGHRVHLIDPVPKHIQQAKKRAGKLKNPFQAALGEARHLDFPDNSADMVILHGPLYHLQQPADRLTAIREAKRVLKPGGIILGFAINYAASTIVGLLHGLIHHPDYFRMCTTELSSGIHNPPDNLPGILTEAYFHRPEELRQEFAGEGLTIENLYAIEGMIWLDKNYFVTRATPEKFATLLQLIRLTETDPALLGFSPHMMIATRKTA